MANVLFLDFLTNKEAYHQSEALWQQLLDDFARQYHFTHIPYMNTTSHTGQKLYYANPLFTALLPSKNRGIRIIQQPIEEAQELYISGWLDTFEAFDDQPPVEELVLDMVLSEEALAIAKGWIQAWLIEDNTKEQLEDLLEEEMVVVE